jgi:DNA-binding CsgD family transcriptional regulator/PAS domain-containing protein
MHALIEIDSKTRIAQIKPPVANELTQFSHAVDAIYDSVLEPSRWTEALSSITKLIGASQGALHFGDIQKGVFAKGYHVGFSDAFMSGIYQYAPVWSLQAGIAYWQVGEVYHLPDILPMDEFLNGRFYQEFLKPHRQEDYMGLVTLKEGSRVIPMSFATFVDEGSIPERGVELMRLLASHICRAIKISAAFDIKTMQSSMLESTLDALASSVFLLNRDGAVLHMNRSAEELLKTSKIVRTSGPKLQAIDKTANEALAQAIASLSGPAIAMDRSPISLALPGTDGGLIATVLPLAEGNRHEIMKPFAAETAVFIQPPAVQLPLPGEALMQLYSLTPSELRVAIAMIPGLSVQEVANILGVGEATIRSHLKNMFVKTGTTRQAEFLQLLTRSMPPVRA